MRKYIIHYILFIAFCFSQYALQAQFYQGSQNEFGKNRVQYRDFLWQQYRFENFDTYFYEGGQTLAAFTSKIAEDNINSLEKMFDYNLSDKVQIIVYKTQTDFKQSNIGITGEEEYNIGGATRIVGSKVFVYFEGDYVKFEKQIREGIAQVLVNQLLYGGNWREVLKNSTLLNLPEWYLEGLILYASGDWDRETESRIRSGVESGKFEKFNRLEGADAHVAGLALWNYIAKTYGDNVIPNILYMSRVTRNVESGFLFVLGLSTETVMKEFNSYYQQKYVSRDYNKMHPSLTPLSIKTKKHRRYTQFAGSPDGRYSVYVSNELGQYRVYLYNISEKKRKKILKAEHKLDRIVDLTFPVVAWHPTSEVFSFINERRGKLWLNIYNIKDDDLETREIFSLDKVLSMSYSPNGQQLIFSGVKNGQTDLYLYYNVGNRQEQLTNDIYGDFDPRFSVDGSKIIFASNRQNDTLQSERDVSLISKNRDIYGFNLNNRSNVLERITYTPEISESHPAQYDSVRYTYLADYKGTLNRYVATYDSLISRIDTTIHYRYFTKSTPVTNYKTDILDYQVNSKTGRYSFYQYADGGYKFYTGKFENDGFIDFDAVDKKFNTIPDEELVEEVEDDPDVIKIEPIRIIPEERIESESEIDIDNYQFEGEKDFSYEKKVLEIEEIPDPEDLVERDESYVYLDSLQIPKARNYNINFTTDYVLTQIDNSYGVQFYQRRQGGPESLNPGVSGLIKLGASDLFENYKILGGFRLGFNLDNNTYLLSFEDLSGRLDKRIGVSRLSNRIFNQFAFIPMQKVITYQGTYRLSFPLNEVFSFRGTGIYRHDQFVALVMDQNSLLTPNASRNYVGLKVEAVFDNVLYKGLNLYNGMRWKVWGEYYRDPLSSLTDFMVFGLDFRHYTKIHRQLIWANRLALSTSLGSERLLYYLGGVDNWMFAKEDNSIPPDATQNFAFQTLASPMRGFFYNSRNGNSFGVINSEIRWPLFKYLLNKPIRSDFVENFQVVGFFDVGSAWTGLHPYSNDNYFNTDRYEFGDFEIEVEGNRDPVVYGYGFGVRSRLLGYFIRADWAWGIDDGIVLPSVFYLSLSLDF